MGQKSGPVKEPAEQVIKEIRRATRRQFTAEEKIRIVLSGLRGEDSIAELCRREEIVQNLYYRWSKEFLEAGKKRLAARAGRALHRHEKLFCLRGFGLSIVEGTRADRQPGLHRGAQFPGDDVAGEVVEHARQVEPTPADHLEIGEVGLP